MKKGIKGFICGILAGTIIASGIANADTLYNVVANGVKIVVDGQRLNPMDANGNPVEPIIYNGTTYLPVRAVANAFGKEVYWDGPTYTVYLGKMNGQLQHPSLYLKDAISISTTYLSWNDLFVDNYGNSYSSAMNYDWSINGHHAEYILNYKYTRFKCTLAVKEGTKYPDKDGQILIKADGRIIYTSPAINRSSAPIPVDINITGCNNFQIEFTGGFAEKIYIADAGFYQ